VQGLENFAVVLVGTNFSVQRLQLEDFDFGGVEPEVQFRVPQALQATAGEYVVQILPDRFQIAVKASQPTPARIEILKQVTLAFVEEYTTKHGVAAVGHNFSGDIGPALGSAADFMKYIAWRDDFATAIGATADPVLSLTTTITVGDEETRTVRLEPFIQDNTRLFYDLNFNWGKVDKPLQIPVSEVMDHYTESVKYGTELIERLMSLGQDTEGIEQ
jgi:hypothetical protein